MGNIGRIRQPAFVLEPLDEGDPATEPSAAQREHAQELIMVPAEDSEMAVTAR